MKLGLGSSEIDGIARFRSKNRFIAYAGLAPTTSASGGKSYQGRMMKACNKWLKWAFIEAAWVAVGCNGYFGSFYRHHKGRGKKSNTAITIVDHRMARIVYELLAEGRSFQPQLEPIKQTFSRSAPAY